MQFYLQANTYWLNTPEYICVSFRECAFFIKEHLMKRGYLCLSLRKKQITSTLRCRWSEDMAFIESDYVHNMHADQMEVSLSVTQSREC